MTKKTKTVAQQIYKEFMEGELVQCVIELQERPWTAVELSYQYPTTGQEYFAVGFSKANWPDQWDENYGADLAVLKACHSLARQLEEKGVELAL